MRTTLTFDQQLLREAKSIAARTGETLSAFVAQAVREKLENEKTAQQHEHRGMLFIPHTAGMLVNVDMNSNAKVNDLLDELDEIDRRERAYKRVAP